MKKILIIIVVLLLNSCNSTKFSKQVLIIPKSYRGEIWIFYDQTYNRGEFKKSWSKITYYVPKDGIIYSKYKPNDIIDLEEYYENGEKIPPLDTITDRKKIYVTAGSIGTLELPNKKILKHFSYFVGDKKFLDDMFKKSNDYKYIIKKYEESLNTKATQ